MTDQPDTSVGDARQPSPASFVVRAMQNRDIEAVSKIERQSFETAWSAQAYVTELTNPAAVYVVAEVDGVVVGYGGLWVIMDEAHITTVAVVPEYRGLRLGERLFVEMLTVAMQKGATRATLEVRASNAPAQSLYKKYGFIWVAIRKAYYADTGENADILWINDMQTPEWRAMWRQNRDSLGLS